VAVVVGLSVIVLASWLEAGAAMTTDASTARSSVQRVATPPIVVPAGTTLAIELAANVNTKSTRVGDRVDGRLAADLVIDDRQAASAGAALTGKVTELVAGSDAVSDMPMLGLTFDSIVAANGATIPILARYRGGTLTLRPGTVINAATETPFSIY
jgi:hypothetical protein